MIVNRKEEDIIETKSVKSSETQKKTQKFMFSFHYIVIIVFVFLF